MELKKYQQDALTDVSEFLTLCREMPSENAFAQMQPDTGYRKPSSGCRFRVSGVTVSFQTLSANFTTADCWWSNIKEITSLPTTTAERKPLLAAIGQRKATGNACL